MGRLLILCGTPATGKSTYGTWLQREHGWTFINHDDVARRRQAPVEDLWWEGIISGALARFVGEIAAGDQDVVVEFGFPEALLRLVEQLKAAGIEMWWFNGDRFAARRAFLERNKRWEATGEHEPIPVAAFDQTVEFHKRLWPQLREMFRHRTIEALPAARQKPPIESIHRLVSRAAGWEL